ncbi:hypothetical protein JOS77_16650 [Chromobacterium haemolyticum]|nr:hypothetical protein JOS77_16650 [Chromobacterium haemolyticum]
MQQGLRHVVQGLGGHADAGGQAVHRRQFGLRQALADIIGQRHRPALLGFRANQQEFVAAPARHRVQLARAFLQ